MGAPASVSLSLSASLVEIAKHFKSPKLTLLVRNPDVPNGDGDIVMTDDDVDEAIAALERLKSRPAEPVPSA